MMETCNQCHGSDPNLSSVIGREVCQCANTQERVASIRISAPTSWLTDNGEFECDYGWDEIKELVATQLIRLLVHEAKEQGIGVEFLEWRKD